MGTDVTPDGGFGRIAISSRLAGNTWPEFLAAWTWLVRGGMRPDDGIIAPASRMPAHTAANWIIERFLTEPALAEIDTLCLVDDDMVFAPDTLERMRANPAAAEFDVVGALYATRRSRQPIIMTPFWEAGPDPYDRAMYRFEWNWENGDVVEAGAAGFGFTLIRRPILQALAAHPVWGRQMVEYGPNPGVSEDVIFSRKVKALGGRIGIDTSVVAGHLTALAVEPADSMLMPKCVICHAELTTETVDRLVCDGCQHGECSRCHTDALEQPLEVWFPDKGAPVMLCGWCAAEEREGA